MIKDKLSKVNAPINLVDRSLEAIMEGPREMLKELFERFYHDSHSQEAKRLHSDALEGS